MDKDRFEKRCQRMLTSESEAEVDETPLRRTSISSTFIDEFVKADLDAGMANCDTRLKDGPRREDDLLHNRVQKFLSTKVLESGEKSVIVNLLDVPPTLSSKTSTTLLKPVIIDGCGVCGCFDKKYSDRWGKIKETATVSWSPLKVLSMEPIFKCLVRFLLRGHKELFPKCKRNVSVILPNYYRNASFPGPRKKVDDMEAFNVLLFLEIIHFIDPGDLGSMPEAIKEEVKTVGALLVSSKSFDVCEGSEGVHSSDPRKSSGVKKSTLSTAFTSASEWLLTPIFFGGNQDKVMFFESYVKVRDEWLKVPEELFCNYTSYDSDQHIDHSGRRCQQLLFKDQVQMLTVIKDYFEWETMERHGIAAILRLDFLIKAFD